jgi:pSer/pThr/pTyr-binding forkhead associated (FHA) protein
MAGETKEVEAVAAQGDLASETIIRAGSVPMGLAVAQWSLHGLNGPVQGQVFPLLERVLVGRDAVCPLRLASPKVSRHHAVVENEGGRVTVRDLGSTNGTFVNGVRVMEAVLRHGDEVAFDVIRLRVEGPSDPDPRTDPTNGMPRATPVPALRVERGPEDVGMRFELRQSEVTVGRADDNDLVLCDATVSSHHARLWREGEVWMVADLGARNGVRVNGERIESRHLGPGDRVTFGKTVLRFDDPAAPRRVGVAAPTVQTRVGRRRSVLFWLLVDGILLAGAATVILWVWLG